MTTEELQTYVDETYPDLRLTVNRHTRQLLVFDIMGSVGFTCHLDDRENVSRVKDRLLKALEDAKKLIEHDIARIKGELE
jgi:hypothetical protein